MEYSINKLSKISGVSTRTLRYYDEIGLVKPLRVASSGYRIYGQNELDILQQVLFYKALDFPLSEIKDMLKSPDFDREKAFFSHLEALRKKRDRLDLLIDNVTKSIAAMKGDITMSDNEKFEGFKKSLISENERSFGEEIREKYGDKAVDESNEKIMNMSKEQYEQSVRINDAFEKSLKEAIETGDPACEMAQTACDLHRQWLCIFAPSYSKEYHLNLADMYVADERFKAHYDKIAPGSSVFLREAIKIYCRGIDL